MVTERRRSGDLKKIEMEDGISPTSPGSKVKRPRG